VTGYRQAAAQEITPIKGISFVAENTISTYGGDHFIVMEFL
jgi:hypothetical protein